MKASVKLSRDHEGQLQKQPIVKAKLPFDFLGFPVHAGFKVCGHIQELALRLSCAPQEAGPSLEVSYRPHKLDRPFTLSLKTFFSPWPSSPASTFTMTAEFNLSRPSNPTFLLRVKPQLGDFSFRQDFCSEFRSSSSGIISKNSDHIRGIDGSSSGMSFTNAFARYASKLHLSDSASSPWHDSATNEIFDGGQHHLRYDAVGNANLASFDSTPYASEKASFARFDLTNLSSEHPTAPFQIFMEEQDMGQHTSIGRDWVPLRENTSSRNPASTRRTSRMDDDWERIGDAISRSTTSASSSTQANRDSDHAHVHRHSGSRSASSLAGWAARGLAGDSHLWACTRLPISPEAHLKIRWSVSAYSSSSSKVPLLPLLLLDKVSLEAVTPCTGLQKTPVVLPFSSASRNETQPENVTHLKQVEISLAKKAREESMSDGGPDVAGLEGEPKPVQDLNSNNVDRKKTSLFRQFLQVRGLLG